MHRDGTPERMEDILCDFCGSSWTDDRPMVEGHRGSCICGRCLSVAYAEVVVAGVGDRPEPLPSGMTVSDLIPGAPDLRDPAHAGPAVEPCCLCLESGRDEPHWRSPLHDDPSDGRFRHRLACRRCVTMAARALDRDRDIDWRLPGRGGDGAG